MAQLTEKTRDSLKASAFGIPPKNGKPGKYPMPDKAHASNAKARASQMFHEGRLSHRAEERIDAKADRKLYG